MKRKLYKISFSYRPTLLAKWESDIKHVACFDDAIGASQQLKKRYDTHVYGFEVNTVEQVCEIDFSFDDSFLLNNNASD